MCLADSESEECGKLVEHEPPAPGEPDDKGSTSDDHGFQRWSWVVVIIFLDYLVIAMPRSILPTLLNDKYGERSYTLLGIAEAVRGALTFLVSPALGALSDAVGRKWLFLLCIVGTASPQALLAFFPNNLEVYLIALAMSGVLAATFPLAFSYITDVTRPNQRTAAFGIALGVGLGGAFLVGPPLGVGVEKYFGSTAVFKLCLVILAANVSAASFGLKESLHFNRSPLSRRELIRRANPLGAVALLRSNRSLQLLSAVVFFFYLALWGFISNSLLYSRRRFNLSSQAAAGLLMVFGAVNLLSQSVGLRCARRCLSEPQIARRCFFASFVALFIYGFAWEAWLLYPAISLLGCSVGGFTTISSLASQVVRPEQVGEAQGLLSSMKSLTEGVGPLVMAVMLPWFENTALPGAPWLFSSFFSLISFGLCLQLERTLQLRRETRIEGKREQAVLTSSDA